QNIAGVGIVLDGRSRQRRNHRLQPFAIMGAGTGSFARLSAHDGHEAGTEAFDAAVVLVAAGLVDGALAAERGLPRYQREAVRLRATVAAAFADRRVDVKPARWIRIRILLAAPALLRRAGLVVYQHGDALRVAQFPLQGIQVAAMVARKR